MGGAGVGVGVGLGVVCVCVCVCVWGGGGGGGGGGGRPVAQFPQCPSPISHNARFITEMHMYISVIKRRIVEYIYSDPMWDL